MFSQYNKAIATFLTGLLAWATVVVNSSEGPIQSEEWLGLGGLFVTTLVTWLVPNTDPESEVEDVL